MATHEQVTRTFTGRHQEDGSPVYETVRHGQARPPESVAEWAECRAASLRSVGGVASRVTVRLLLADTPEAVKAAVAAGQDLSEVGKWAVLKTLERCQELAREGYSPASGRMDQLASAWTRAHGARQPRDRAA